jgi:DNA-binding response OmpR family regulator
MPTLTLQRPTSPLPSPSLIRLAHATTRFEVVAGGGRRAVLDAAQLDELRRHCTLFVDVEAGTITSPLETLSRRAVGATLLAEIIAGGGAPVPADQLYCRVWSAPLYHPLRHRNTLYVALYRLRRALDELLPGQAVIETAPGGWRVCRGLAAAAVLGRLPA